MASKISSFNARSEKVVKLNYSGLHRFKLIVAVLGEVSQKKKAQTAVRHCKILTLFDGDKYINLVWVIN